VSLFRILVANRKALRALTPASLVNIAGDVMVHRLRDNRLGQAQRNIAAHYDLSNELYRTFLDDTMTYSAAVFEHPGQSLEDAQLAKYRLLAERIRIDDTCHVLEIGCGWGGFAIFAASTYGCRVTGITLSEQQADLARQRVVAAGLEDLVDIRLVDYREVTGQFDRIVSIEMLEAVGHRHLGTYFEQVDRLLAPDGLAAIQVITIPEQRYDNYLRRPDFIQRYIFPGGHLPSLEAMCQAMGDDSQLYVERVDNIGIHYAETLRHWRETFMDRVDDVRALGFDDRFVRMWEFYLAYCEAAFLARYISDLQIVLTRPMNGTLGIGPYGRQLALVREADLPREVVGVSGGARPGVSGVANRLIDGVIDRGALPDPVLRAAIRALLRRRLAATDPGTPEGRARAKAERLAAWRHAPVALSTDEANEQHYEVPTELFELMLGPG
jgi:cyclopropane-fatty-acyl-phospholipid synthase